MARRILIADDDLEALRLIGLMLERKGYEIVAAASGEQALKKIEEQLPDLIILDVMMPGVDGYEVARHLRENPRTAPIPILFFTAKSSITDKIAGFQAGGDDYLTKPIHPAELLSRVEVLLQRSARQTVPETARAKVFALLPVKGGVGNSTLALNMALQMAQVKEKRTILVELVDGGGSSASQLGASATRGLQSLVEKGPLALSSAAVDAQALKHETGLRVLPASPRPAGLVPAITEEFVQALLRILLTEYDHVLFDLSPTLNKATTEVLHQAQYVILTFEPTKIALALAHTFLESLEERNIGAYKVRPVFIHRAPAADAITRDSVKAEIGQELLASIPPVPDAAYESWSAGQPMLLTQPQNLFSQQVRFIVDRLLESS